MEFNRQYWYYGIGTTTPSQKLHIADASSRAILAGFNASNPQTRILLQNNFGAGLNSYMAAYQFSPQGGNIPFSQMAGGWSTSTSAGFLSFHTTNDAGTTLPERMRIESTGNVGIGTTTPTSKLQIAAGTTTVAPFQLTSGTNLTTPIAGAIEFDGSELYVTPSTARYVLAKVLKGSSALDFPSTLTGATADLTIAVTGAVDGDAIFLGVPSALIVANTSFIAWVSGAGVVTVRFTNNSGGTLDPASGTFKVTINK